MPRHVVFKAQPTAGETPLPRFFEHLLANYDPQFTDFVHYVDVANERCAAMFLVTLTPKPDSTLPRCRRAAPVAIATSSAAGTVSSTR